VGFRAFGIFAYQEKVTLTLPLLVTREKWSASSMMIVTLEKERRKN